ncbi:MAG: periplasmic heavy metal sensor [Kofleriaceae bacterium]
MAEAIAGVESDPSIPPKLRASIVKSLKQAQRGDLSNLGDLAKLAEGFGDDLKDSIQDEVEQALRDAGIDVDIDLSGKRGSFSIDLNGKGKAGRGKTKGVQAWKWNWNDDDDDDDVASPFDDDRLDWLKGTPFAPGGRGSSAVLDQLDLDDVQLDAAKLAALSKIAGDEEKVTKPAQRKVEELGRQLTVAVAADNPNQAEIDRLVDAITAEEARIRKARLAAMTQSRKLLGK